MEEKKAVLRRKAFLINLAYFGVMIILFYLFMRFAFWTVFPFILAFIVAVLLQKPVNYITKKTPLKRGFTGVILVLLVLFAVLVPLALIIAKIVMEFIGFADSIKNFTDNLPQFLEQMRLSLTNSLSFLPDGIEKSLMDVFNSFAASFTAEGAAPTAGSSLDLSVLKEPLLGVWNTAKQIPSVILSIVLSVVCCCFMTADFPRISDFILRQVPPEKKHVILNTKKTVFSSMLKIIKAYLIIMLVTFTEMFIALNILKAIGIFDSSYIFVIAFVTCVVDIVPVLGTGTILMPWALINFLLGNIGLGIGLVVIYAVITVIRQVIEPKLVAAQLGIPPFITLIAMFLGLKLFGFIGLILLPLLIAMIKVLNDDGTIRLWKRKVDAERETSDAEEAK